MAMKAWPKLATWCDEPHRLTWCPYDDPTRYIWLNNSNAYLSVTNLIIYRKELPLAFPIRILCSRSSVRFRPRALASQICTQYLDYFREYRRRLVPIHRESVHLFFWRFLSTNSMLICWLINNWFHIPFRAQPLSSPYLIQSYPHFCLVLLMLRDLCQEKPKNAYKKLI